MYIFQISRVKQNRGHFTPFDIVGISIRITKTEIGSLPQGKEQ